MKIIHSASGKSTIVKFPIDSNGTTLVSGALLTMGVTAGSNMGALIVSGAAAADAVAILLGPDFPQAANGAVPAEADSTIETGVTRTLREVELLHPGDIVAVDYDQTDTVAVASGSTTTGVITSSDEETGCWHYYVSGATNSGYLAYIKSYNTDTATYLSALAADPSLGSPVVIRIVAPGRTLAKLTTNASKLGTDAGEGTADVFVIRNEFTYDGAPGWIELDYTKHHGLNLLGLNPKFRAILCFTNCALSPIA
jgi:hypothetical protein